MPRPDWDTGVKEHNPETDFHNPVRDGGTGKEPHYRITVCDDASRGKWEIYKRGEVAGVRVSHVDHSDQYNPPPAPPQQPQTLGKVSKVMDTDGSVDISGHALPNTNPATTEAFSEWDITITLPDGSLIRRHLRIRVIDCSHHVGQKGEPVPNPPVTGG